MAQPQAFWFRELHFNDASVNSHKFYQLFWNAPLGILITRWGRIGTAGQVQQTMGSAANAAVDASAKEAEKVAKGYVLVRTGQVDLTPSGIPPTIVQLDQAIAQAIWSSAAGATGTGAAGSHTKATATARGRAAPSRAAKVADTRTDEEKEEALKDELIRASRRLTGKKAPEDGLYDRLQETLAKMKKTDDAR